MNIAISGGLFLTLLALECIVHASGVQINSFAFPQMCDFDSFQNCKDHVEKKLLPLLKGKSIVMMGDSITRYQYLSLVYTYVC